MKNSISNNKRLLFLLICILILTNCQNYSNNEEKQNQQEIQWTIDEQIQRMQISSRNMNFSSIKQKYFYIYYPVISQCLQKIGEDFQPYLDSVVPVGISAASIGIAAGGILKTGLLGFLKVTAATTLSASILPITLGVGALTLAYNMYSQNQIKQRCKNYVKQMQEKILSEQIQLLQRLREQFESNTGDKIRRIQQISSKQKQINQLLTRHNLEVHQFSYTYYRLNNYFQFFNKLNSNKQ